MKWMLAVLLCLSGVAAAADPAVQAEIQAIQARLSFILQQQQAVFQEFQMIQELRRLNSQLQPQTIDYEENLRERLQRDGRSNQLASDLNDRYARYRELEEQKAPLLERLNVLSQPRLEVEGTRPPTAELGANGLPNP